jgi:hypothetical protein
MLRKLRAAIQPPAPAGSGSPASQPTAVMLSGGLEVGVVGESHYQDALTAIGGGKGPVYIAGRKVGHLPRPAWCLVSTCADRGGVRGLQPADGRRRPRRVPGSW